MKEDLFYKTTKIIFLFAVCAFLSNSLASEVIESQNAGMENELGRARSHFQEDASVIGNALEGVKHAELHFFWTTGRQPDAMNVEYGANLQVVIGGHRFAQQFPAYVGFLLENSPTHLIVKIVCDELTRESNKVWISALQATYQNRFQILDIRNVTDHILQVFPDQKDILQTIFDNATKGNPAIASDIYRLIGLVYGSNPTPTDVEDTQFTYCDVDTFCFGMSVPNQGTRKYIDFEAQEIKEMPTELNGHTNLINALFSPMQMQQAPVNSHPMFRTPTLTLDTPVYIGRKGGESNGNNLIKLRIRDLSAYKRFCLDVLWKIQYNERVRSGTFNLLTYFPTLHDHVSGGALDAETEFASYLEKFSSSLIDPNDIMYVTGPGLVDRLVEVCFPLGQEYPDTNAMEWNRIHYLEQGCWSPTAELGLRNYDLDGVKRVFTQYARKLSNAFYALRFGANHPFTMKLLEHLRTHFPYADPSFKACMKQLYESQKNPSDGGSTVSIEDWLDGQLGDLIKGLKTIKGTTDGDLFDAPYYVKLHHVLQQLGIDRPLTRDDLDFRITD